MSRKEDKMSFDKLFYLFKYGEKENPWEKLEQARVKNIKKELAERVVGQDEAIEKIEKTVVKAYMGLTGLHKTSSRSMPKGVFFFVGPTGVGKTELSKALAKFLFGDEQACIVSICLNTHKKTAIKANRCAQDMLDTKKADN